MRYLIFIISSLLFRVCICDAQTKSSKAEARKLMNNADYAFQTEDYLTSWLLYKKVLNLNPKKSEAALNAAVSAYKLKYSGDSTIFLSGSLDKSGLDDAYFYKALIQHAQKQFFEAIATLEKYKKIKANKRSMSVDEVNYQIQVNKNAMEMVAHPKPAVIRNLGPAINSPYPDYVPVIVPDGSAMYFTSKRLGNMGPKNGDNNYLEDIYVSYNDNGSWTKAKALPSPINSERNDACVALSPDGQNMFVYRTSADGLSGDLYRTRLAKGDSWEPLRPLGPEVNSAAVEASACFSNDSNEVFFSSDRPGGHGGKDLYRIRRLPNGKWSLPLNLGKNINTKYDEDAPFVHPDGVTLYFSSKGHNTMGNYDVFKSVYDPDKNEYSKAENLGYPINDVQDDIFFVLTADGQKGYYSSVKSETQGGMDIYEIDTKFEENSIRVRKGEASLAGTPARVRLTLFDADSGALYGTYLSNPDNGKFIMAIDVSHKYKVLAEADGYQSYNGEISGAETNENTALLKIDLKAAQ